MSPINHAGLPRARQYIQNGWIDDEDMLDGIYDFEFGEEFFVLVIEYVDGPEKQEANFHRMNKRQIGLGANHVRS